jgi:allantoate deiminase
MKERAERVIADCRRIALMTEEPGRTTRRFLTEPTRAVHALLRERMEALGMKVAVDAVGNLRGLWKPRGAGVKRLLLGSHIDTVPDAGAFDGVLGVMLTIEWVGIAREFGLPRAIEVIAFSEEEGMRYGVPFLGSRAVTGAFDTAMLKLSDADGVTMDAAMRAFGLNPAKIEDAEIGDDVIGFVELHAAEPALHRTGQSRGDNADALATRCSGCGGGVGCESGEADSRGCYNDRPWNCGNSGAHCCGAECG